MNCSLVGCVTDETTGQPLTSPDVKLYRIGVLGESSAELDERGCFSFPDLAAGDYSLGVYDSRYVPQYERFTLTDGGTPNPLHIALKPGGFLSGSILDQKQQPPWRCFYTLIHAGERRGESGYISDSGDHRVSEDGTFCSPPLAAGRYFLRFAGILVKPTATRPPGPRDFGLQERVFDFLYPEAQDISDATGFDIQAGQTVSGLRIQIPTMVWHTVRGRVTGDLPIDREHINVVFSRTMGTIDCLGGAGALRWRRTARLRIR